MPLKRPLTSLVACLALAACSDPDLEIELDSDADAEESGEDEDSGEPALPPALDDITVDTEPQGLIGGLLADDESVVKVLNIHHIFDHCTGTLLRNDVVLTARHCVTTDGTDLGPLADPSAIMVQQDGPGATLSGAILGVDIAADQTFYELWHPSFGQLVDVAIVRLSSPFSMNGNLAGESTEIMWEWDQDLIGEDVICMGFGETTCGVNGTTLTAGLNVVEGVDWEAGHIDYGYFMSTPWMPAGGDSGGSCRISTPAGLRVTGVVSKGTACTTVPVEDWTASEVRTRYARALAANTIKAFAGNLVEPFGASEPPHFHYDPPVTGYAPLWLTYPISANYELFQFYDGYVKDDQTQEGTKYVWSDEVVENGTISVRALTHDRDVVGLIARMRSDDEYYRFSVDENAGLAKIVARDGSSFEELAASPVSVDFSTAPELEFTLHNNQLTGSIDGVPVVSVTDEANTYLAGRAGLYTYRMSGVRFDDFGIDRLTPL